ncbi:helix-turn-helix DNA binding domain protein [Mycobacterium phage Starcevich]|nr:helix-turn-helix DNA binding domain protein [Mycobacterium phage Starcevich]
MSCYKKSRRVYSERTLPKFHVLNPDDVRRMRKLAEDGWTQRKIAAEFGVSEYTVSVTVRRLAWPDID